jgi:hypothetical protein
MHSIELIREATLQGNGLAPLSTDTEEMEQQTCLTSNLCSSRGISDPQGVQSEVDRCQPAETLREAVINMLSAQGYSVNVDSIDLPPGFTKDDLRRINQLAVAYRIKKAEPMLRKHEANLLNFIADGDEIYPERVRPKLIHISGDGDEAMLFRYLTLHWSIPVSSGYGRRLRFLVMDSSNNKVIGLFGLGDPVYSISSRDQFVGWDRATKAENLYHVMDAYVLGAVPPYSHLLCGKLVALLALSNEVRQAFSDRYGARRTTIRDRCKNPWLALITTTSALGKSSIYNRIHVDGYKYWRSIGFTQGSGEFHFSNGIYEQLRKYAEENCTPTAKKQPWGKGFRSKREVIKKALPKIGLSARFIYHGIRREVFAGVTAENALSYLRGETGSLTFYDWPADQLSDMFLKRWLLPRAERNADYTKFRRDSFALW